MFCTYNAFDISLGKGIFFFFNLFTHHVNIYLHSIFFIKLRSGCTETIYLGRWVRSEYSIYHIPFLGLKMGMYISFN